MSAASDSVIPQDDDQNLRDLSTLNKLLLYAVHKKNIALLTQGLHPREKAPNLIHEIDFRLDPHGSTVLSSAIHWGQGEALL